MENYTFFIISLEKYHHPFCFRDDEGEHLSAESVLAVSNRLNDILRHDIPRMMQSTKTDISLSKALSESGWTPRTKVEHAAEYLKIDFESGSPASELSAKSFYLTGDGDDVVVTDYRGYEHIAEVISKPFKDKILFNKEIRKVKLENGIYKLILSTGELYTAKYILSSVSSKVLQSNYIYFQPPLPNWKMDALKGTLTGDYCKIFLKFPYKFWEDSNYIMIGRNDKIYTHWQNFERMFSSKSILLVTLTGEECRKNQLETDYKVLKDIHILHQSVYGPDVPMASGKFY